MQRGPCIHRPMLRAALRSGQGQLSAGHGYCTWRRLGSVLYAHRRSIGQSTRTPSRQHLRLRRAIDRGRS